MLNGPERGKKFFSGKVLLCFNLAGSWTLHSHSLIHALVGWVKDLEKKVKIMGWDKDSLKGRDNNNDKRVFKASDAQCNCSLSDDQSLDCPWAPG